MDLNVKNFLIFLALFICLKSKTVSAKFGAPWKPGLCSKTCSPISDKEAERLNNNLWKFPCVCGSSCKLYGDCCYDAQWNKSNKSIKIANDRVCLPLYKNGRASAVSSCSKQWSGSTEFCSKGFGHLPPVTSLSTEITYINRHCAVCNEDAENLIVWNVKLRCCPDQYISGKKFKNESFVYFENQLWNMLLNYDGSRIFCECTFFAEDENYNFLNVIELHQCERTEISTCSESWSDRRVRKMCKGYLDPIYIGNKVYRNLHCAICNYEYVLHKASCIPDVVKNFLSLGISMEQIYNFCKSSDLNACLHYVLAPRGRSYALSELFAVRKKECIPPEGRRCCTGYRYDFRHKKCRKRVSPSG